MFGCFYFISFVFCRLPPLTSCEHASRQKEKEKIAYNSKRCHKIFACVARFTKLPQKAYANGSGNNGNNNHNNNNNGNNIGSNIGNNNGKRPIQFHLSSQAGNEAMRLFLRFHTFKIYDSDTFLVVLSQLFSNFCSTHTQRVPNTHTLPYTHRLFCAH